MRALIEDNPQYQVVTLMRVDWDKHSRSPISRELKVKSQSVLVMFNGGQEIGRVEWSGSKSEIEPLFQAVI